VLCKIVELTQRSHAYTIETSIQAVAQRGLLDKSALAFGHQNWKANVAVTKSAR